ncbi:hypothetical protein [Paractinoplanes durhamensis]|uniref:hypothetical protein n=1 Tax=Paractinoplanes durhamensis TaxID=113563 RepID=UPI003637CCAA
MAYDPTDLRSTLPAAKPAVPERFSGSEHVKFRDLPPVEKTGEISTWYARGQNFVVGYSDLDGSASFRRQDQPDEYVVLLADDNLSATVGDLTVTGKTMLVIPPGDSTVTITGQGRVLRLLTTRSADVAALAANASSYDEPHENIPPFQPWPDPPGGFKIRAYDLTVPPWPTRRSGCSGAPPSWSTSSTRSRARATPPSSPRTPTTTSNSARSCWPANTSTTSAGRGPPTRRTGAPTSTSGWWRRPSR